MTAFLKRLYNDEMGGGIVEYALILALVAIAAVAALTTIGTKVTGDFNNVGNKL
jgi:pilus assembly protein Flp/PilA